MCVCGGGCRGMCRGGCDVCVVWVLLCSGNILHRLLFVFVFCVSFYDKLCTNIRHIQTTFNAWSIRCIFHYLHQHEWITAWSWCVYTVLIMNLEWNIMLCTCSCVWSCTDFNQGNRKLSNKTNQCLTEED